MTIIQLNIKRHPTTRRWSWELENRSAGMMIGNEIWPEASADWTREEAVARSLVRLQLDSDLDLIRWMSDDYVYMRWVVTQVDADYEDETIFDGSAR